MEKTIQIESSDEKYARRRKKVITYHLFIVLGYGLTQIAFFLARAFNLCATDYRTIAIFSSIVIAFPLLILIIILLKKNLTNNFAIKISYIGFVWWLVIYAVFVYLLGEVRVMGLFFALMPITFLLTSTSFYQTLYVALGAVLIQVVVSYYAIHVAGQAGNFIREAFIAAVFLPSATYLAYLSGLIERQRDDIKKSKEAAEDALERVWTEMDIARKIQTVLLPKKPQLVGYDFFAYMEPAEEVGGDYYDVAHCKGKDWLIIGDVSGHGVSSGLVMMMVQTAIHTVLNNSEGSTAALMPAELIRSVNKTIYDNIKKMHESKFMTITVFLLEAEGRVYHAGLHEDIYIYRSGTQSVERVETDGMWLGLSENIDEMLLDSSFKLNVNDIMFAYTDGITEARKKDAPDKFYGQKRLEEVIRKNSDKSVNLLSDAVLNSLESYNTQDDVTFMILKRK